jgi:hypothetical protein
MATDLPDCSFLKVISVPHALQLPADFNLKLEKVKSEFVSMLFDIYNNLNAFSWGLVVSRLLFWLALMARGPARFIIIIYQCPLNSRLHDSGYNLRQHAASSFLLKSGHQ